MVMWRQQALGVGHAADPHVNHFASNTIFRVSRNEPALMR